MKLNIATVVILIFASTVTFSKSNSSSTQETLLVKIKKCVDASQSVNEVRACTKDYFAASLTPFDRDQLTGWFKLKRKITRPAPCDKALLTTMPEDKMKNVTETLCATYVIDDFKRQVIYFYSKEESGAKLLNLNDSASVLKK